MPGQTINVFVSYSHADGSLVAPVVRLLRVNKSLVFQDTDGIAPGTKWRAAIAKALSESNLVVVFWCRHAHRSDEVQSEWRAALEQGKDLLPLLLDGTPLPSELSAFQWIDFRGTVGASHSAIEATPLPRLAIRPILVWPAVAAAAAVVLTSVWIRTQVQYGSSPPDYTSAPPDSIPVVPGNTSVASGTTTVAPGNGSVAYAPHYDFQEASAVWIPLLLAAVVVLGAGLLWLRHRRKKRESPVEASRPSSGVFPHPTRVEYPPPSQLREIAVQLEAEIIRRTAPSQNDGT
jgi:TIR domain